MLERLAPSGGDPRVLAVWHKEAKHAWRHWPIQQVFQVVRDSDTGKRE
jgi:hypothetical protein